jgi:hypothetical protein
VRWAVATSNANAKAKAKAKAIPVACNKSVFGGFIVYIF